MTQHQENERPQFSMSMFASREELFKAQMEWEIKEAVAAERERIAKQFDDEADRQEKVWNDFLATKTNRQTRNDIPHYFPWYI